ncbi:radical SAM protein [Pelotomaculum sp. FP]|uniref:radical SAM protein n=1 Tax=Pelotomaculum sp. FP TaxID=261474 RepID=UPI0010668787|nr:radical SAM protein [Pelotomaculum sp. FP]
MNKRVKKIIDKSYNGALLGSQEIRELLELDICSEESFYLAFKARQMSEEACAGKAEIHGQVGVNSGPCSCNCAFCSFAAGNKIFNTQRIESLEFILQQALDLEEAGANAIYLMATAHLNFQSFLEMGQAVRRELRTGVPLIANIADFSYDEAVALRKAGFTGVYHAARLGEGKVTRIELKDRLQTFEAAGKAGLILGTCVEPIGPEHSHEEIVEKMIVAREAKPGFSGAMRRVTIPGTSLSAHGMLGETRMAHIVAAVRLATPREIPGNCTHEPNVMGAVAGANLLWAEAGSNPRDVVDNTEKSRGYDVGKCREILVDAGWQVLDGPSKFFSAK